MRDKSEGDLKKVLGLKSLGDLSKTTIRFAAMRADMAPEVAMKIVEQFPKFKELAKDILDSTRQAHESTLAANKQSQDNFHRASQEARDIYKSELARDDLSPEQREGVYERIDKNVERESQKDSETKNFLDGLHKKTLAAAVVLAAIGVGFASGNVRAESENSPEDSPGA